MELKNKGVLVTGGASGLGAACARLLAQGGAKVVIADLNSEGGERLAAELRESGATVFLRKQMLPMKSQSNPRCAPRLRSAVACIF